MDGESILTSIKKLLNIAETDESFDPDVIIHINSCFFVLCQLGIGPIGGFSISDKTKTWVNYITDIEKVEAVKSYVYLKVRLIFDPPQSAFVVTSMEKEIAQYEWRLNNNK